MVPPPAADTQSAGGCQIMRSFACLASLALAIALQSCAHVDTRRAPDGLVGAAAPEISGEDLDGVLFRLSDYRGQVVLLDFWGNW